MPQVGTAKNIAKACNILPRGADILEITVETHPVLGELQTSQLIAMQVNASRDLLINF